MQYRKWSNGTFEFNTSYLGFGCMRFPTLENGEIDEEHSQKMIDYGIKNGVNYIDTAWFYHQHKSEEFVGRALAKYNRNDYYLATKLPIWVVETKEEAIELFNKQLENLRTDYFDTYLVHALNKEKWLKVKELGVMEFLEEMKEKGIIRSLGFSFHSDLDDFELIVNDYPWEFCQIQINYMDVNYQQGLRGLEILQEKNIPCIIMEPLKGGLLSNVPEKVKSLANFNSLDMTDTEAALKWFNQFDNIVTILSGMSHFDHIVENIATLSEEFVPGEEFLAIISSVRKEFLARTKVNCTSCDYCMPCPHKVNIPGNFRAYNNFAFYEDKKKFQGSYNSLGVDGKAENCIECKICEEKCPQNIKISDMLVEITEVVDKIKDA